MNGSSNSLVNTIIAPCVAGGVVGGMYMYITRSRIDSVEDSGSLTSEVVSTEAKDPIVESLERVQQITFDGAIFDDAVFRSLNDFEQPVQKQPEGRINPFLPIETDVNASSTVGDSAIRAVAPLQATTTPKR